MSGSRFSIVIPTRNRENTLGSTLRTCLAQDFDDYEIVVSDNHSTPATRAIVGDLEDARLKYVRSPEPLTMTDSMEFALSHASGEYVIFVGSDDGLVMHALPLIDETLRRTDGRALRWESVLYHWPDTGAQDYAPPNRLLIPLTQVSGRYAIQEMDSRRMIRAAANAEVTYARLLLVYCSAVHRDLVELARRRAGRVFRSKTPDTYASFAFAYLAGTYHSLTAPLSIAGQSGRATGLGLYAFGGKSPAAEEFRQANVGAGYRLHPWVPDVGVITADIADAFLHAKTALFPDDPELSLDRKRLIADCLSEVSVDGEVEWCRALDACRRTVAEDGALRGWFDGEYGGRPLGSIPRVDRKFPRRRYSGTYLNLDAAEFQVRDVAGAAELCEKILGYRADGMVAELRPAEAAEPIESLSELQRKEAVIQELKATADERLRLIERLVRERRDLTVGDAAKIILRRLVRRTDG
jgi:Glycosyl transferase family 2